MAEHDSMTDDLARQEELARTYQQQFQDPLVGEKKSSRAITEEYAKADPIYVAKTVALPNTYSHYRPIIGDGNCGWRAAGFSYFETLLRLQDKSQMEEEIARMTSLNNLLTTVGGFEEWLFEDMVEETSNLLRDLASSIYSPKVAEGILLQRFNNPEISNAIVYHFRLLASSWLKGYPASYQDFIPDNLGVDGYRKEWLEAVNQEIDHLGMTLLIDVLLKPIGFTVEIVYLDRSEGSQVNTHMIQPEDSNGIPTNPGGPTVYLLYRPSHYDILYKEMEAQAPLQQAINIGQGSDLAVNRATSFSQQHKLQGSSSMNEISSIDLTALLTIPGFHCAPPPSHGFPAQYHPPIEQTYTSSPISASISPISTSASTSGSSNANLSLSTNFTSQQSQNLNSAALSTPHSVHTPFQTTTQLPIHTIPHQHPHPQSHISPHQTRPSLTGHPSSHLPLSPTALPDSQLSSPQASTPSFRPSKYNWGAATELQEPPVTFQTSTFKNSHYNTAHYNNPNFQPEEWSPDCEEAGNGGGGYGQGRKKSS